MSSSVQSKAPEAEAPESEEAGLSTANRGLIAILAIATFLSVVNTRMVNVALPTIQDVFDLSEARAGWLVTLYSLFFGIATPFYGRLGDRYGLRPIYIGGVVIFATASLLASLVPTSLFPLLVLLRIGQGVGSAAIPSLGMAMIMIAIPRHRRGAAIGLVAASVGAGQAVGPMLGGALTEFVSWRATFFLSAIILILIPFQLKLFAEEEIEEAEPVDWLGGIALGATVAGLLIGIGNIQGQGLISAPVLISFGVAIIGFLATLYRQRTESHPFVARVLLGNHRYLFSVFAAGLMMSAAVSATIIAPFLLEDVNDLEPAGVGLVLLSQALMVTLLSRPVGKLADRYDGILLAMGGVAILLMAIVIFASVAVGWSVWALVPVFILLGIGQAAMFSPLQTTLTRTIPPSMGGTGFGLYYIFFFSGSALGAAMATALLTAREGTEALLPLYLGPVEFSRFGDAYLYGLFASAVALILLQLARRAQPPSSEEISAAGD